MGKREEKQREARGGCGEWQAEWVRDKKWERPGGGEKQFQPGRNSRHSHINHGPELERSIDAVKKEIGKTETIRHKYSTRFLAIKLLENDKDIEKNVIASLPNASEILRIKEQEVKRLRETINEDSEQAITDAKYGFITGELKESYTDDNRYTELLTR